MDCSTDDSFTARRMAPAAPAGVSAGRVLSLLTPAALALYANFQGLQQTLIPLQLESIDPARKIVNLAALTVVCSVTGVLGLMIGGAASDATRSRWGRRTPWLAGMAAASAILSSALGLQRHLIAAAALCGALWFTLNFFQAALLAVVPDRVPERRRGLASSVIAVAGPLGALLGVNLAALAPGESGYVVLTAILAASTAILVVWAPEGSHGLAAASPAGGASFPGLRLRVALRSLNGFRSRDFSLAFALRMLMFVGQFSINNYLLYILQDRIGVGNLPAESPQIAVGALNSIRNLTTIGAIFLAGWFANRSEQRKPFVQVYAIGMAAAMLIPAWSPSWSGMVLFSVLGGLAMGVYSAVDLALMSHVLPNKAAAGRDLAMLVMAGAVAQFLAPVIGGALIKFVGYDSLFVFAAILTTAVGATTFFFRGVR